MATYTRELVDLVADACDATNRAASQAAARQHITQVIAALEARDTGFFGVAGAVELTDQQWANLARGARRQLGCIDAEW